MTENTTTEPTSDEPTATLEETIAALPATYQALATVNLQMLSDFANQANALARKVKAQENIETTLQDIVDNADDAELVAFREWRTQQEAIIAQAEAQARDKAKSMLGDVDQIDPEKALAEWTLLNQQYNATVTFMKKNPVADFSGVLEFATPVENMGRKRGSGGTGVRRPRVARIEYRVGNGEWVESYTDHKSRTDNTVTRTVGFPALSSNLKEVTGVKVDPGVLIQEADAAANTTKWVELEGKPFTFHVSVENDGTKPHLVEVRVTPKANEAEAAE